jgi:hypothetical protein
MANSGLADLSQQTPMPQIDPANDFEPPLPATSPTPLRYNSVAYGEFIASFCTRMGMWPELCPDFTYIVQGCSGLLLGDDGTQDSTARVTFPKVSHALPAYMLSTNTSLHPDAVHDLDLHSDDSSGEDWLPDFGDTIESSDSDFDVDNLDEGEPRAPGLERWCMTPESFAPVHMDSEQLAEYYRKESWNSSSVDFVRTRDNFTGPTFGLKRRYAQGPPQPHTMFNLYWTDACVDRIVVETNRYARAPIMSAENEAPRTKGGPTWKDVTRSDIRGWLGICILMGCKRLPNVRQYWMCSQPFLYCQLISSIMSLGRWEQIMRCLHLVDNNSVVRDVNDPRFD